MFRRQDVKVDSGWQAYVLALMLALALVGCSRQPSVAAANPATGGGQQLPFDRVSDNQGISPTGELTLSGIPAGTPISVQLRSSLSSALAKTGDHFEGVLDQSIIVQGQAVAARGASVSGRVVAAIPGDERGPGYLRLTLSVIAINGKTVPVLTSSFFAKGVSNENPTATSKSDARDVTFSTGRRLTFRVAQVVPLPN
jgi:hypothetical protein